MNLFAHWKIEEAEHVAPGESAPAETAPAETAPVETAPVEMAQREVTRDAARLASVEQLLPVGLRKLATPDETVQAVADYSVDYSKRVFFGVITAARKWQADDAGGMAACVAYYLALSLFPMLLLLTAGLGLVFRFTSLGQDAEKQILMIVAEHCSPTLEQQVREVLAQIREHSLVGGPFGLCTAILAAIGVFYQFERAFDRIWRIKPKADKGWLAACLRIVSQRLSAFCLLAAVGAGIVLILLGNLSVGFVHAWMTRLQIPGTAAISAVDACTTLLFNAAVFGMLYRWLPKRRIQWVDALRGGLLAALIWEAGRQLLGAVLIGVKYTAAYGAIGSFIALLLWCYWGVSIILFGAEYAQVLSDQRRGHDDCSVDEELEPLEERLLRKARQLATLPYPAPLKKTA